MRLGSLVGIVVGIGVAACSGSAPVSVIDGPPEGPPPAPTGPTPIDPQAPPGTARATYAKSCGTKAALPGKLDSALLAFTLDYPSTWNNLTKQQDFPKLANYSTVGAPKQEEQGDLWGSRHYIGDPSLDPAVYLRDLARRTNGEWRELKVGGHPAVSWWERTTPAAPGCAGCSGDVGPDFINIHLAVGMGGREIVQITGSARVTALPQVFCDIQAIEASFAASK